VYVSPFSFNSTYDIPVHTTDTKCPNQVSYVSLDVLLTICAIFGMETWFSPNDDICNCLFDMSICEVKTRFDTWIKLNDVNGVSLFHLSYLITFKAYL
jgi:hypothetical protein